VDRSRAFEIAIRWKRIVCKNGLTIFEEDRLRKAHNIYWMSGESPVDFISDRLPKSRSKVLELLRSLDVPLTTEAMTQWIDNEVSDRWGVHKAARVMHILKTGHDCAVGRRREKQRPSDIAVESLTAVPGAKAPAANVYDAYQALLWIVNKEPLIEKQDELLADIMDLVDPLLPAHSRSNGGAQR
jgi:hypothetical protein